MASFIFEEGTQIQASAFTAGDTLIFRDADPASLNVTFTASTGGLSVDTVTISDGTHSFNFAASALDDAATTTQFLSSGGSLIFTTGATTTVAGDDADAAYNFTGAATTFTVTDAGNHVIHAGSAGDTIDAGTATGDLNILGGKGVDTITVGDGNNIVSGGAGADSIIVGDGNNHVYGNALGSVQGATDGIDTITVGDGSNYVNGNAGNDIITTGDGSSRVYGGQGDDNITVGNGNNHINGNAGSDTINMGTGNNTVNGGQGDDHIFAGTGNNTISGDLGNDDLHANTGIDILTGGAGNDVFDFSVTGSAAVNVVGSGTSAANYYDEVTDFTNGTDHFHLGNATDAVLTQGAGVTFTSVDDAQVYAQQILTAGADDHAVAAIVVGSDTYLFYNDAGAATTIDSVIKVDGFTDTAHLKAASFV
ncbi:calcium-binding protein [Sphingomonas sp. PR090111-T3T-6A]|uniref:calcium-binding protein n=1 Tax=Sphingomonas sp. PR090111-T3T-6A TaxID=685778 RepID=UPI0003720BFE|nr:calcium-binding protein [Sphingomonas sp. PR090111-T3T-6A]